MNGDFRRHAIDGGSGALAPESQHIRRERAPSPSLGRIARASGCPRIVAPAVSSAHGPPRRERAHIAAVVGEPAGTDREVSQSAARRRLTPDLRRDR
jgi:hypothetical protein